MTQKSLLNRSYPRSYKFIILRTVAITKLQKVCYRISLKRKVKFFSNSVIDVGVKLKFGMETKFGAIIISSKKYQITV